MTQHSHQIAPTQFVSAAGVRFAYRRFGKPVACRSSSAHLFDAGALTGEERIREKTTELYGEILNYEGRPTDYQAARIDSLKKELDDVAGEFDAFVAKELPAVNKSLVQKKLEPIQPIDRKSWDATDSDSGAGAPGGGSSFRGLEWN